MPMVIRGKTTCAISGKIVDVKEKIIGFPTFIGDPRDPAFVCSEACVLRDEFEKWDLKDHVIKKLREFWSLSYRMKTEVWTVIFEDSNYLFVKSEVEDKVRILFHQHVFTIDVPKAIWHEFCKRLLSDWDVVSISPYSNRTLLFRKRAEKVEISSRYREGWRDCINLSWPEWSHFKSILAANEALFD